jgi:DNA-binding SARP family transcriptional activator/class 3 adenylate cyclase
MLSIRLLGEMQVARDGVPLVLPPSRKTRGLLAYLTLADRPLRRERLCSMFWDVPNDPKGALRWSLSKLRLLVDEPDHSRILATRDSVAFDATGAHVDFLAIRKQLKTAPDAISVRCLEHLAAEFRGEFLEGLDVPDSHEFEHWRIAFREEARALHKRVLAALVDRLRDTPAAGIVHARNAVQLDPADTALHMALLRLLANAGQREAAEEQYTVSLRQLEAEGVPSTPLVLAWRQLRQRPADPLPLEAGNADTALQPVPGSTIDNNAGAVVSAAEAQTSPPAEIWAEGERKFASVLVASVHGGSTADSDPEEASRQADALSAAAHVATRFGGIISSAVGGTIVALFGAPRTLEDHAVQACRAALAMRAALLEEGAGRLDLRACLDAGEVLVRSGILAPEAIGQPVQTAGQAVHRLPLGVVAATQDIRDRTRGYFRFRSLDPINLADRDVPILMLALQQSAG